MSEANEASLASGWLLDLSTLGSIGLEGSVFDKSSALGLLSTIIVMSVRFVNLSSIISPECVSTSDFVLSFSFQVAFQ